jgi:uncharacterized radical SAM superfamily Fe-S cluster-containing enzyme
VQLNGGEPTLRDDLPAVVALCAARGAGQVEVVTNGLRLGAEPGYAARLKASGVTSVYLQFDSTRGQDLLALRGADLSTERLRALDELQRAQLPVILGVPLVAGVNDGDLGAIFALAAEHPAPISGISINSAAVAGRWELGARPKLRLPEMLGLLEAQVGLPPESFFPLGYGSPLCNAFGRFVFKDARWRPAVPGFTLDDYLELLGDDPLDFIRASTRGIKAMAPRLMRQVRGSRRLMRTLWPVVGRDAGGFLRRRQLTVFLKPLMDLSDLDLERTERCCYHSLTPHGLMSFCALNALERAP